MVGMDMEKYTIMQFDSIAVLLLSSKYGIDQARSSCL